MRWLYATTMSFCLSVQTYRQTEGHRCRVKPETRTCRALVWRPNCVACNAYCWWRPGLIALAI